MSDYLRPRHLDAALAALAAGPRRVIAGGTDVYPAHVGRPLAGPILDITALDGLRGIEAQGDHWRIGALTTWAELARARLPPWLQALATAARDVGGAQIQNAGTLGGNLCNASPAADGAPCLLAADAEVELASAAGRRRLPLAAFLLGNRRTALRPDELMTAVLAPRRDGAAASRFLKLGARRYLVISIVMVAAVLEHDAGGRITRAGVAVGACAPVACRLPALEARLVGERLGPGLGGLARADDLAPLAPIDDVRGTAEYRRDAALTLARRALDEIAAPWRHAA